MAPAGSSSMASGNARKEVSEASKAATTDSEVGVTATEVASVPGVAPRPGVNKLQAINPVTTTAVTQAKDPGQTCRRFFVASITKGNCQGATPVESGARIQEDASPGGVSPASGGLSRSFGEDS